MSEDSSQTDLMLQAMVHGDKEQWGTLLTRHRERLRRMVTLRLDRRLQSRIDASAVIKEVYLEASTRLPGYLKQPAMPFFLWLRFLTSQKLLELHRQHLGAQARDLGREVSLYRGSLPETNSTALAAQLLGHLTQPSQTAIRAEMKIRLQDALNNMEPLDREVLTLRHFELLSNAEAAYTLGIRESAASKRYVRALKKLKAIFAHMPGGIGEVRA